jgi:ABC-2 type transport system permease protein
MSRTMLAILKREYMTRITGKAFWISTALFPLLMFAITVLPSRMAMKAKGSSEPVVVVDTLGDFYPLLDHVARQPHDFEMAPLREEKIGSRTLEQVRHDLNVEAEKQKIQGYIVVDAKTIDDGAAVMYAQNPSSALSGTGVNTPFAEAVRSYRMRKLGMTGAAVDQAVKGVDFDVQKATNDPKKKQSGVSAFYMSFGLVMFIYFSLILYGVYVLQGVLEEKTSRVVEVIVSSVKPFDLMMGKIVGIGAVGLTQITIWLLSALVFTAPQLAAALSIAPDSLPTPDAATLIFFPVYFVLGFFLFASIYAGIGSMFNSMEDAQQMTSIANLLLIVPIMMLGLVIKNPNGTLSTVLSLIPFFSPVLMYLRIAVQFPPVWQIALSIAIMLVTIVLMVWLVGKIYRVGILMYGKKPTIPEVLRWLKYT